MLNVGVVGCGYWGPNLVRNFRALDGCAVTTVCDADGERLEHMAKLYPGIRTTQAVTDLVHDREIHAVAVATPVHLHHPIAKSLLEGGKHVFVEKPLAASVGECRELLAIAEDKGLRVVTGHTFVYTSAVRKIRELIRSGDIGDVLYISSRRLNLGLFQKDINVAWDLAPHDISILLYVLEDTPISVNCQGSAHVNPEIEDVTAMTLQFQSGAIGMIHSSWIDPRKIRETTIVGSKKMIVYDDNEPLEKIKIYDKRVEVPPHYDTYAEFHYSYHYGDMWSPYLKQYEPLKVECQSFVDAAITGAATDSDGSEGLRVVQILEAASQSLRSGGNRVDLG